MAFYVVTSGRPAGELYDREVHIVQASSPEQAIEVCQVDTSDCCHEWLWGPSAWPQVSLMEAVAFAAYRAEGNPGEVYSHLEAHGFGEARNTLIVCFVRKEIEKI